MHYWKPEADDEFAEDMMCLDKQRTVITRGYAHQGTRLGFTEEDSAARLAQD